MPILSRQHGAYGFRWSPSNDRRGTLGGIDTDSASGGIHVSFVKEVLDDLSYFFGDGDQRVSVVPLPDAASSRLTQLVGEIRALRSQGKIADDSLRPLQGFIDYTARSLSAIFATATGCKLIKAIEETERRVFIVPARSNSIQCLGSESALCWIARQMTADDWRCVNVIQDEMLHILREASDQKSVWVWLANRINQMPLYSLFKAPPHAYPNGFLKNKGRGIKPEELRDWFTRLWSQVGFRLRTSQETIEAVRRTDFIRCAVIIALYDESLPGAGADSTVRFNTTSDPNDPEDMNAARPPQIGLAHELVHAMHNAAGTQPGFEIYHFTTTLVEQLCVGVGPFEDMAITENAIRAEWPPKESPGMFWSCLGYDDQPLAFLRGIERNAVAQRTAYDAAEGKEILTLRKSSRTI